MAVSSRMARATHPAVSGRVVWSGRLAAVGVAGVLAGSVLAGCGGGPGGTLTASAVFTDVGDLVNGAAVQYAGITVGNVTSIRLDGDEALVTMSVDRNARVPSGVTAELVRQTVLGQRVISLVRQAGASGAGPGTPAGLLENGARIARTEVVPGIQELLQAGAQVFGAINDSELSSLVAEGAQGFGGQGATLHQLLDGFSNVVHGYAGQSSAISSLVISMEQLASQLAPSSKVNADALVNLAQATAVLARESQHFEALLASLDNLAKQGHSILSNYSGDITTQLEALDATATTLASKQQQVAELIQALPAFDKALPSVVDHHFLDLLDAIVLCGVPNGGSSASNPAFSCAGGGKAP